MSEPLRRPRNSDDGLDPRAPIPRTCEVHHRSDKLRSRGRRFIAALVLPVVLVGCGASDVDSVDARGSSQTTTATPSSSPNLSPTSPGPTSDPGATSKPASVPTSIPGDFPLTEGWPDPADVEPGPRTGIFGPSPGLEDPLFAYAACGKPLPVRAPAARLRAIYRNVEDTRTRQLLTFGDAQGAVAFMADLVSFYRGCPQEAGGPQAPAFQRTIVTTGVGGQSYAMGGFPPTDQPVGSTQVLHAVRVGSAVFLDTTEGEGGTSINIDALTKERARLMTTASAAVVSTMCRFTAAGC